MTDDGVVDVLDPGLVWLGGPDGLSKAGEYRARKSELVASTSMRPLRTNAGVEAMDSSRRSRTSWAPATTPRSRGGVNPRTSVTVIGDGAVGLLAVLSAKRLGAEQIILMGRHTARTDLGREFGATDVLEAVGHMPAYQQAYGVVRPGGTISRVGVPQYEDAPIGFASLFGGNVTLTGGPAPTRAHIEELVPDILGGAIEPGRVFDAAVGLDGVPGGYEAMANRKSLKVLVTP